MSFEYLYLLCVCTVPSRELRGNGHAMMLDLAGQASVQ